MNNKTKKNNKGFTLIEMLVSVAVFSVVLTIVLGTIVTIVDTSRKARSMTEVMNNLNFSFESMTRTLKSATKITTVGSDKIEAIDQSGNRITYSFSNVAISKQVDKKNGGSFTNGENIPITSSTTKIVTYTISKLSSGNFVTSNGTGQPRIFFSIKGRVETTKGISSEFNLQSTVSQRQLEI
jgi:prepilin-type N-terminal cleavage/methylation domain-containing protein